MKTRRVLVIVASVVGSLVVFAVGLGLYGASEVTDFIEQKWRPDVDRFEVLAPRYVEAFCADAKVVAKSRIPRTSGSARNAGEFINPRLAWDTPDAGVFGPSAPIGPDDAGVARFSARTTWATDLEPADCDGVDTRWLHQLSDFDHWSLVAPSSPNTAEAHTRGWPASDVPLPKSDRLYAAAKLHLGCAMLDGGFVEAAKDVEQLARLAHSTESAVPAYSGPGLMRIQGQGIVRARELGLDAGALEPVSDAEIDAYRRMMKGIVGLTSAAVDDNAFNKMLDCARAAGLECIALTEGAVFWSTVRQGAQPWAARARLRAALVEHGAEGCRLDFAKYRHDRPMLDASEQRLKDQMIGTILALSLAPSALTKTWPKDAGTTGSGDAGR
jgi:hypothetical protein